MFTETLAYLDPGTGSVVLQFVIGGILGAALMIKIFWQRLLSLFGVKKSPENSDAELE